MASGGVAVDVALSNSSRAASDSGGIHGDYVYDRGGIKTKDILVIGGVLVACIFAWGYLKKARK